MFSKATEYALRATIYIAQKSDEDHKLGIDEIATAIDSPKSFTAKILQSLTRNQSLIGSVRGTNGGFYMNEKQRLLPVRAILKAMDEEEVLEKCVLGLKRCTEHSPCPLHFKYKAIKQNLIRLFDDKTIQELADEMNDGKVVIRLQQR